MMLQASGVDKVLQEKEFSRWSSSHGKQVSRWVELSENKAKGTLSRKNWQAVAVVSVVAAGRAILRSI